MRELSWWQHLFSYIYINVQCIYGNAHLCQHVCPPTLPHSETSGNAGVFSYNCGSLPAPCHCFSTVPYLRVNSVYWWKSVRPSGVLWVLDSVVLTGEGTWPEAANRHAVPSVCGCGRGCWSQRSASRFTEPTKKKIDVLWQPQNFK